MAARVGHDVLATFTSWAGALVVGGGGTAPTVTVAVQTASFEVLEGTGGVTPLSDGDRRDVTAMALRLLDVERHPTAEFRSTGAEPGDDTGGRLHGTLAVRGRTVPVTLEVSVTGPRSWTASCTVLQSTLGIPPYRAFLGALRLADPVRVEVAVDLDAAGSGQ
jgi:polyisoprenoid-binding protein YceI